MAAPFLLIIIDILCFCQVTGSEHHKNQSFPINFYVFNHPENSIPSGTLDQRKTLSLNHPTYHGKFSCAYA
jgi:hypothetical protein